MLPRLMLAAVAWCVVDSNPPAAETRPARPNILFIIFDDWNVNHAGAYGCDWIRTPGFDRVAREGILFRNAFTSNPKCSPCRASILTGRSTWQLEEASCHNGVFPGKFAVYPDLLEKSGYFVGLTGKGWGPGDFRAGGFTRNPAGPSFDEYKATPPATGINRNDYSRNFQAFLEARPAGQPFCFWMGFHEPHRAYEEGSGLKAGKSLTDVHVPGYLPHNDLVRSDLLDYAVEVESADQHIVRALQLLEAAGELDNTLIIVTSDHGMPFPRVKGQIYEDGFHLPMALRWGQAVKPGRTVDDFVNVRDLAPTYLELAGLGKHPQISGTSLTPILYSDKSGTIEPSRTVMLVGKERHDLGRPHDWGYPVRAIRTPEYLYVHNYNPERWPACNPETGLGNCDASPTKSLLVEQQDRFYDLAFGLRPAEELYRVQQDPECLINLASSPALAGIRAELRAQLERMLRDEGDPRETGNPEVFDTYQYVGGRQKSYDAWLKNQQDERAKPATKVQKKPARSARP